jgi:hypothetical protein
MSIVWAAAAVTMLIPSGPTGQEGIQAMGMPARSARWMDSRTLRTGGGKRATPTGNGVVMDRDSFLFANLIRRSEKSITHFSWIDILCHAILTSYFQLLDYGRIERYLQKMLADRSKLLSVAGFARPENYTPQYFFGIFLMSIRELSNNVVW